MAVFLVTGKLGSGKSLACVGRMRDALLEGRRVATNLDIFLERLMPSSSKSSIVRLPDKPSVADLDALGMGQEGIEEERNGVLVLDECAAWLNSRSWGDKSRQGVIDWLIHSRKRGWDVYFICQHIEQVDKQIRTALVEFLVVCRRWDRLAIPVLTGLFGVRPPKIHMAIVKYGTERESLIVDRWWYRARDLYLAYDTRQGFRDLSAGSHSLLSAWHLKGRFEAPRRRFGVFGLLGSLRFNAAGRGDTGGRGKNGTAADRPAWLVEVMRLPPDERISVVRLLEDFPEVCVGFPIRTVIRREMPVPLGAGGPRSGPLLPAPPSLVNCAGTRKGRSEAGP